MRGEFRFYNVQPKIVKSLKSRDVVTIEPEANFFGLFGTNYRQ